MKSRKLGIGLLLLLAFVFTTGTFAYWASSVSVTQAATQNESVTIGEADTATTTVDLSGITQTTGTLVPSGQSGNSTSTSPVETITLSYDVDWTTASGNPAGTVGTLAVSVGNISGDTNGLVQFDITSASQAIIVDGDTVTITIDITMNEPADQTEYDAIANASITFDVTFNVTVD